MISGIADDPKVKEVNADGSVDLYFGPEAPEGKEKNWIKTISVKGDALKILSWPHIRELINANV